MDSDQYGLFIYDAWNRRLLESFFSSASRNEEVFLHVSPSLLDSLGPDLGGDDGFLHAVRNGPKWVYTAGRPFAALTYLAEVRSARTPPRGYLDPGRLSPIYKDRKAPAYLPYLASLARSAADCDDQGFYKHLRKSLRLPDTWHSNQMSELEPAWEDLQLWTKETSGEFGRFSFRVLGHHSRIGVPRSQVIMSVHDAQQCNRLFFQEGLRPGQSWNAAMLQSIRARASQAYFLSTAFRQALRTSDFREPIAVRLEALFQDWDGTVPREQDASAASETSRGVGRTEVGLVLGLQSDNGLPWRVQWLIPAIADDGQIEVRLDGVRWAARMGDGEGATARLVAGTDAEAARVLAGSELGETSFDTSFNAGDDEPAMPLAAVVLGKTKLRTLVWKHDIVTSSAELREDALPLFGEAYLLTPPSNARRLTEYLDREKLPHEIVASAGLPDAWVLACLLDCSVITAQQRDTLPDGEDERQSPRVVRLVGGLSLNRGGTRQYMSYDLPAVELDAPGGAILRADGLCITEEAASVAPGELVRHGHRRFRVRQGEERATSYNITAEHNGKQLGSVRLRVSANVGEHVEAGEAFGLDAAGYASTGKDALRGALVPNRGVLDPSLGNFQRFEVALDDLGKLANGFDESGGAQFLDSLAQAGSMAYGTARDLLARLLANAGSAATPMQVVFELRARGHVEVQVNHKGHLVRVHAVPPAFYELPISCSGNRVLGLLGSLRLAQWHLLGSLVGARAFNNGQSGHVIPTLRMVIDDADAISREMATHRIGWHGDAAANIAEWAADLVSVSDLVLSSTAESLGASGTDGKAEKFVANNGYFRPLPGRVTVDRDPSSQLFRLDDLETGRHRVHVLSSRVGDAPRYAFVRDSRWGIWIALRAFAEFVRENYGIDDASPWPVPYLAANGTLLLPARIGVPVVVERALALCSGSRPQVIAVDASASGDLIQLDRLANLRPLARVSRVYAKMAKGNWLAYHFVPRAVAEAVASKVGAVLADA